MARAINHIDKHQPTAMEEQTEALGELLTQLADNREALSVGLEIIKELHEAGMLEMVKSFLSTRQQVGAIAMEEINQPGMHNIIKNGFNAIEFLGGLDPDGVEQLLNGVNSGIKKTSEGLDENAKVGIWRLIKLLKDPHVNTSIATMVNFLDGMGSGLNKKVH